MRSVARSELQRMYAPAPPQLYEDVRRALNDAEKRKEKQPMKRKMSLALLAAALLALACLTALAVGGSRLLERLFPNGGVPEATAALLNTRPDSATENGVTLTVTETLFDGDTLLIQAEVLNGTDETLYAAIRCGSARRMPASGAPGEALFLGGSGNTLFDFGAFFTRVPPGEAVSGSVECRYDAISLQNAESLEVHLEAVAMRATAPVSPVAGELYSYEDLSGSSGEEAARVPLTVCVPIRATPRAAYRAEPDAFRMPGYTLKVTNIAFAPASASVAFAVVPDDPADIALPLPGEAGGRGRLVRDYAILDEAGSPLDFGWEGWAEDGALCVEFTSSPFAEPPRVLYIVPLSDGAPIMDEAAAVRVVSE